MQKKYGFSPLTSIETKTNLQQKQEKVLNHKFVDSLIEEINMVNLTKEHKVVVIDLNALDINLDKFGDYFWEEMKKIKVDKTKRDDADKPTIGSSGIMN
ncbi:hypothetical protein [Mycoplasma marinum]|uniref:Uncharacterized protein n=1 Tax=Mycoplasma marinum TaxID=1937190 RepID=A0A4R0XI39_9MOLU|nr:hypothetical protein [Mycoplasma marinum]TCG10253.1 hypothetical protein C4B24_05045 [Mycoplasma marinum]